MTSGNTDRTELLYISYQRIPTVQHMLYKGDRNFFQFTHMAIEVH